MNFVYNLSYYFAEFNFLYTFFLQYLQKTFVMKV